MPLIFELYSQFLDFNENFLLFLTPIIKQLEANPSVSKIQRIEELLNKISSSLMKNESVNGEQMLALVYTVIQKGFEMGNRIKVNDEKAVRDYGEKVLNKEYSLKSKH